MVNFVHESEGAEVSYGTNNGKMSRIRSDGNIYPLITRDPVSGDGLIVTRLECPTSGIVIEGRFDLGWIGRLTREQLDFVELMVKYRGNVQKLGQELNIAYNTARSRLDDIVEV